MPAVTLVFDLDGTLVDTAPDLVDNLNWVFTQEGVPPVPVDAARNLIGVGVRRMIERGLQAEGRSCAPAELDRLFAQFNEHYADDIADRSRPFPAAEWALDKLAADGCRFAICTNKLEWLAVKVLDALGLSGRFRAVVGQYTFGIAKPNPDILRKTVLRAGGTLDRTLMVGDSGNDITTARATGVPIVAVDFGYTETPVVRLDPDCLISSFEQLPAAVHDLLARASAAPVRARSAS